MALGSGAFDGAALAEANFRAACRKEERLVKRWHEKLGLPAALDGALEAAVLELQIDAVWGWADAVADDTLAREELERLADGVHNIDDENKLEKVCEALGVEATEKAEVSEAQFRDRCRWDVRGWFEKLELPLLRPEAGCLEALCTACCL